MKTTPNNFQKIMEYEWVEVTPTKHRLYSPRINAFGQIFRARSGTLVWSSWTGTWSFEPSFFTKGLGKQSMSSVVAKIAELERKIQ